MNVRPIAAGIPSMSNKFVESSNARTATARSLLGSEYADAISEIVHGVVEEIGRHDRLFPGWFRPFARRLKGTNRAADVAAVTRCDRSRSEALPCTGDARTWDVVFAYGQSTRTVRDA